MLMPSRFKPPSILVEFDPGAGIFRVEVVHHSEYAVTDETVR